MLIETGLTGSSGYIFVFISFQKKLMKLNPPLVEWQSIVSRASNAERR